MKPDQPETGPQSGASPPRWSRHWSHVNLEGFPNYVTEHYPELAAAFEQLRASGRPEINPGALFLADRTELQLADGAFKAIHADLREGLARVFNDSPAYWSEGMTFMAHIGLVRAFMLGAWLGEVGLARLQRPPGNPVA